MEHVRRCHLLRCVAVILTCAMAIDLTARASSLSTDSTRSNVIIFWFNGLLILTVSWDSNSTGQRLAMRWIFVIVHP